MKEQYDELELKIVLFDNEDVITASGPDVDDDTPGGGWHP